MRERDEEAALYASRSLDDRGRQSHTDEQEEVERAGSRSRSQAGLPRRASHSRRTEPQRSCFATFMMGANAAITRE